MQSDANKTELLNCYTSFVKSVKIMNDRKQDRYHARYTSRNKIKYYTIMHIIIKYCNTINNLTVSKLGGSSWPHNRGGFMPPSAIGQCTSRPSSGPVFLPLT